jgi:serine/threonine protein kinase SCH9
LKAHPFFSCIDWVALCRKEVTPPFKPSVESDESTANFDPEFTSADLRDVGVDYWDDDEVMMVDSSSGQRLYNGPAGSERMLSTGASVPEGAIDVITPIGSFQPTTTEPAMVKATKKKRSSSPISRSLQDEFRGFSYTASESMDESTWGALRSRVRAEEDSERESEAGSVGREEAVGDDEITLSKAQMSNLRGEFGEADDAMRRMHIGASQRY